MSGDHERFEADLRDLAISPVDACPDPGRLVEFYAGRLDERDADEVREHVALCRSCLALARDAREFVQEAGRHVIREPRVARPLRAWLWAATAAASIAGLVLAGLFAARLARGPVRAGAASRLGDIAVAAAPYVPDGGSAAGSGLVWRDGGGSPEFRIAMEPYVAGNYAAAQAALETFVQARPDDDRARFYLAVTRLLRGAAEDARRDLAQLANGTDPALRGEARWYLALASLKSGHEAAGRSLLQSLADEPGPHRGDARQLLPAHSRGTR